MRTSIFLLACIIVFSTVLPLHLSAGEAEEKLMNSAKWGETDKVQNLLAEGADVNAVSDENGMTPLMYAAYMGKTEAVKTLLKAGADVNAVATNGDTAIHKASHNGHLETVKVLHAAGANLEIKPTYSGQTALRSALANGRIDTARFLLEQGAEIYETDRFGQTVLGNIRGAKKLRPEDAAYQKQLRDLAAELDKRLIEIYQDIPQPDKGASDIIVAAKEGNIARVHRYINEGTRVDARYKGYTALMIASQAGHLEVVDFLISKGSTLNNRSAKQYSALILAAAKNHPDVVQSLVHAGAGINAALPGGQTPLSIARKNGYSEIEKILVKAGAQ